MPSQTACNLPALRATVTPLATLAPMATLTVEVLGTLATVGPTET